MKLGYADILFLIFMVLKLTNVIDWSWWWVSSPMWITFVISVISKTRNKVKDKIRQERLNSYPKSGFRSRLDEAMRKAKDNS